MNGSTSKTTCTRRLTFESGHRVVGHEGKCKHPHGHSYKAFITVTADQLDSVGRVIDFGVLKTVVGKWLDDNWDHAFLRWSDDREIAAIYGMYPEWKQYECPLNPTAENLARILFDVANDLLRDYAVRVVRVRMDETENGSAEYNAKAT